MDALINFLLALFQDFGIYRFAELFEDLAVCQHALSYALKIASPTPSSSGDEAIDRRR